MRAFAKRESPTPTSHRGTPAGSPVKRAHSAFRSAPSKVPGDFPGLVPEISLGQISDQRRRPNSWISAP